jgi:uncharacterized phage protein (TIGR01671 family)
MREIKFRAWIKDSERMNYSFTILENPYIPNDEVVLMQYTGLKDKNGKEIYEGDIIRRDFEIGRVIIDSVSLGAVDYEIDDSGCFIGVVSYRPSEGFVLNKCKKYNDEGELQSKKSGVKIFPNHAIIIGNNFENPELLEL